MFDQNVSNIRSRRVFGTHYDQTGIRVDQRCLLRATVADVLVTTDGDPFPLSNEPQPAFIGRILWQVIIVDFTGNSGLRNLSASTWRPRFLSIKRVGISSGSLEFTADGFFYFRL